MYRPAADVDGSIRSVEEFYEVVFIRGARVAAAGVDLAENNISRRRRLGLDFVPVAPAENQKQTKKDCGLTLVNAARE